MFRADLFEGRTAIVTGAGRGIGKEIAVTMAELGADVGVNDLYEETAEETVAEIEALGQDAVSYACDVSDSEQVAEMVGAIESELGLIHHVVNNAGTNSDADLVDLPSEEWERVMSINVDGTFEVSRLVARRLMEADETGSIINMSSITGVNPQPGAGAYTPSKAAVIKLTQQMAIEWAESGVRANAICPGLVWTPATDSVYSDDELYQKRKDWVPIQKIGSPADIARAAVFLLAPENGYVTGETMFVDGGAQNVGLNLIPGRAQHE